MSAGRYDEAIPVLQRAVAAFPEGSTDLTLAYALYNLGRSLRLAGATGRGDPDPRAPPGVQQPARRSAKELAAARRGRRGGRGGEGRLVLQHQP